ncbi:ATP-dependent helicase [Nocardioides sp. zg-536]|uniref:DNA 3'-5' helicase n=1 Tax=Nocardioides faecalis TaxID=2803858 RepID=A0A939BUC5_9ACTN|nr:ATP-dependent DNA helicase [Nocardioides faecalis]MBM9461529.1 ATP-dependent helicase [Nocardioides faecalis]QVI57843.1 ATP-dependent helicase [Nocardioides faecalis]
MTRPEDQDQLFPTSAPAEGPDVVRTREIRTPEELQRAMRAKFPPSPEQWRAITAPLSPVVVIAGAGSGKTTLMAARVVYLVLTGQVRPEEILGLTFTTKAAAELRQRIRKVLSDAGALDLKHTADDEEVLEPTVATYNAYAAGLLVDHGLRIGHEPDTRVITDAARYQLGARAVDRYDGPVEKLSDHPPTVIQNLLTLDGSMSEHLVTPARVLAFDAEERRSFERALAAEAAEKNRKTYVDAVRKAIDVIDRRAELMGLVASYRRLKSDLGLMDFSDQIALAARLASEQPEVGRIERERFKVVLLDEYQDTSVAQATLLSRLFGEGHPVMAVGDPNQAIYGWRGASVSNIINFPDVFPTADGSAVPVLPLTVNRRSDTRILDVANALAAPLMETYGDKVAMLQHGSSAPGAVRVKVFETNRDELAWLAEQVRATHDGGTSWAEIAVLSRDNQHGEAVFDALTAAGIPVEIVGLSGLVRLPEVATVVATLKLVQDVTDNASLLSLLAGPRWAVGPRDLRLLAERAFALAGRSGRDDASATLHEQLVAIADGIDPAEIPCLDDALADPGEAPYSPEALERFGLLRDELRMLRAAVGEPLLDLVRRIVDVTGVDVELAAAVSEAAPARRENLDLFVKAVADFQAVDGDVSLPALIAWLTAEDEAGNGLEVATPSEADSVKLLTVHRSKGLEWATVFCVGVGESRFPSTQGRSLWTSSPCVLPAPLRGDAADLPQLAGHDKAALDAYRADTKAHEAQEELRLGYVAFTRPAHELWVTSFLWGNRKSAYGPSSFQATIRELCERWEEPVEWRDKPERGAANPLDAEDPSRPWPVPGIGAETARRLEAAARVRAADPDAADPELDIVEAARVADWDQEIERLLTEARAERSAEIQVALPPSLSATALARLRDAPDEFARELARPMPKPPAPAARFGTRFHAWVETRFGQQGLFDPDELAGRGDAGIEDDADLKELIAAFEDGPFGSRVPAAVEAPFSLVLHHPDGGQQVVRGRIDAVYDEPDGSVLVVDWKTGDRQDAEPLQLALYRLAWAELHGLDLARVRAAFYYVRTGRLVVHDDLPGREGVESLLSLGP